MTELPDTNGGNGSASDKKEDQGTQSLETAAAALASVGTTEESSNGDSLADPPSGKREHNCTTPGIMGGNAKRGKREWLSFRGARHTRVGEDYQVASLPPMGGTAAKPDDTIEGNEKGN